MPLPRPRLPLHGVALFGLALLSHALRAWRWPEPDLWDASYYRGVAGHIAAGDGAVTGALWSLLLLPPALPMPADLYWMPLPSRVLVPGALLSSAAGPTAVAVLLASLWAPLAWALARRLSATPPQALAAGLVAAVGGMYARQASMPDCFGLVGVLGGLGFLSVLRGAWLPAAACAAGLALSRSDGALFGLALALGLRGAPALAVAAAGPLAAAGWQLRNLLRVGPEALALRAATTRAPTIDALVLGTVPDHLGLADRLQALLHHLPAVLAAWFAPGVVVLAPLALLALARGDAGPLARPLLAWWLGLPLLLYPLAPGAAHHGALYRSGAAAFPLLCALAVLGLARLNDLAVARRDYDRRFLPTLLGLLYLGGSVFLGRTTPADALPADLCAPLARVPAGAPVFAWHPLAVDARCGHPAVVLLRADTPERVAWMAARYGIRHALPVPTGRPPSDLAAPADLPALLPGWTDRGGGLWAAP